MNKITKRIYEYINKHEYVKREVLNCLQAEIQVADDFNIVDKDEFLDGFALSLEQLIRDAFEDISGEWGEMSEEIFKEFVIPVIEWKNLAGIIYAKV